MYFYDPSFFVEGEELGGVASAHGGRIYLRAIETKRRVLFAITDRESDFKAISEIGDKNFNEEESLAVFLRRLRQLTDLSKSKTHIFLIDMAEGVLQSFTINAPLALCKRRDSQITRFGKIETAIGKDSKCCERPTREIATLVCSINAEFIAFMENHIPFVFSSKEINTAIGNFKYEKKESYGFFNLEVGRNKTIGTRSRTLAARLDDINFIENELDAMFNQYIPHDDVATTNAMLAFHELLMNALEYGSLGLDNEKKQALVASGEYDDFIARADSDKKIKVSFDCYANGFVRVVIVDSGEGFNHIERMRNLKKNKSAGSFRGRGIKITHQSCAALFFRADGRESIFFVRSNADSRQLLEEHSDETLLKTLTVLYVDNDEYVLMSVERLLKHAVNTLLLAKNGNEALELFKIYKPDVVVTDIDIPEIDGLVLAEKIRAADRFIPIVVFAEKDEKQSLLRSAEISVDKFLLKPLSFPILRELLVRFAYNIYIRRQAAILENAAKLTPTMRRALVKDERDHIDFALIEANVRDCDIYGVIKAGEKRAFLYLWILPQPIEAVAGAILLNTIAARLAPNETLQDIADEFYENIDVIAGVKNEICFALIDAEKSEIEVIEALESKARKLDKKTFTFSKSIVATLYSVVSNQTI
ncbi:MAG: response regulator [Helicobacteraceae bacterium]|jgi:CheY-like chemotaxis protein/anti-sigma regulatory factor (Ser/Thr protein kinase)|nr:response regulator [Helicobacteraceae bacterium]